MVHHTGVCLIDIAADDNGPGPMGVRPSESAEVVRPSGSIAIHHAVLHVKILVNGNCTKSLSCNIGPFAFSASFGWR